MSFMKQSGRFTESPASVLDYDRLADLTEINRKIFASISDLEGTIRLITQSAQQFLNVRRCTVWLVDPDCGQYLIARANENPKDIIRVPIGEGLVGWVATHKQLLNVPDAYQDPRFYSSLDEKTGYKTKSILSIPIFSGAKPSSSSDPFLPDQRRASDPAISLVGVLQLLHDKAMPNMTEMLAIFFAEYVGVALSNCVHYRQMQKAQMRTTILMDIMTYHYRIEISTVIAIESRLESEEFKNLMKEKNVCSWSFSPRTLAKMDTTTLAVWIFRDLGILERLRIPRETIVRFVLTVQKSYRDEVPYHNWLHAVSVLHFSYLLLKLCPFEEHLSQLQRDILPLAALTHDIDHRGTNNAFQQVSMSDLAALYSSEGSILERHHLAQTMCILNIQSCAILNNLSDAEYSEAVDLIQHLILITDIANHCKKMPQMQQIAENYHKGDKDAQKHVLGLMMTCCDLNQVTKPIDISLQICDLIYQEFYAQGDHGKQRGHTPIPMMNRDTSNLPSEQIGFITYLARPAFELLAKFVPETQPNVDNIDRLLEYWKDKLAEKSKDP